MGYDPGGDWFEVTDCGREDNEVCRINGRLLARQLSPHAAGTAAIFVDRSVVKECGLFRRPQDILPIWQRAHPRLRIVALWREPAAQYASWSRKLALEGFPGRWEKDHPYPEFWQRRRQEAANLAAVAKRLGVPLCWLRYPDFLEDLPAVLAALAPLDLDPRAAAEVWSGLVDRRKVHCGG
jgi:hypothetical protein